MEAPELLSVESFSYRWLVKLDSSSPEVPGGSFRKSFDDEASFIEMDPAMPPSRRFSVTSFSHDLKFDFPVSRFPLSVVHADELFAEGYLLPLFFEPARAERLEYRTSDFALPRKKDSRQGSIVVTTGGSPERRQRLQKHMFPKHLNFLKVIYKIFRLRRLSFRWKRGQGTRNWVYPEESPSSSPRISKAFSTDDGRESSFSECSIYEAVLHCKKSIGREMA